MSRQSRSLIRLLASEDQVNATIRNEVSARNLSEMKGRIGRLRRESDEVLAREIRKFGVHHRFRRVEDAEREGLVYLDHACTAIIPHEVGVMAYGDLTTGKIYAIFYTAR